MNGIRNLICSLLLAGYASGCTTGRLADLRDCGRLSLGGGIGLGAHLELGILAHPAIGIESSMWRSGFENRNIAGVWKEHEYYAPAIWFKGVVVPGSLSYVRCTDEKYLTPVYQTAGSWINLKTDQLDHNTSAFNRATDLEAGAALLLISFRAGVNPLEMVDFVLGFVGVDIAKDDPKKNEKEKANHGLESTGAPPAAESPETHP